MAKSLDREVKSKYHYRVRLTDLGVNRKTAETNLTITIIDVNDNTPVFSKAEYLFEVLENTTVNANIGQVCNKYTENILSTMCVYLLEHKLHLWILGCAKIQLVVFFKIILKQSYIGFFYLKVRKYV